MKVHIVFVTMFLLLNCSDEVKFRSPSFEAQKDGIVFWNANFLAADIDNNGFIIEGRNAGERLQLITTNDSIGVFEISGDSDNEAIYVDKNGTVFSTKYVPDPNISIFPRLVKLQLKILIMRTLKIFMEPFGFMLLRRMAQLRLILMKEFFIKYHYLEALKKLNKLPSIYIFLIIVSQNSLYLTPPLLSSYSFLIWIDAV